MKTLAALSILAAAGTASAAVFVQNDTYSFPLSPGGTTVDFLAFQSVPGWNPSWILTSVELIFDITIGANVTAENDSALNAPNFGLTLNGSATVSMPASLNGFAAINSVAASGPLGPSDGIDGSGPDYFNFGFVDDTFNGGDINFGPGPGTAPYDVAGLVTANIAANAAFGFTGTTDATLIVSNLGATGNITLIYNYIPAPGAVALMGMAGLAATRRRR